AKHLQCPAVNLIAGAVKFKIDGHIAAAGLRVNPQLVALLPNLGRNAEFGGAVDDVLSGRHSGSPSAWRAGSPCRWMQSTALPFRSHVMWNIFDLADCA